MKRKFSILFVVIFLFMSIIPTIAFGNSAQPPAFIIIMNNAPDDVKVSLVTENGLKEVLETTVAWETYFVFYYSDIGKMDEVKLKISGGDTEYEQVIKYENMSYDGIVTFDFNTREISAGKLILRSIILVGLRVILTLAIEGLIFCWFGFKEKRSWIVFLVMNLITQGWLNISLNDSNPVVNSAILWLILMEFLIFIVETITVLVAVKEHGKIRRFLYVFVANFLSLILGGLLIAALPI